MNLLPYGLRSRLTKWAVRSGVIDPLHPRDPALARMFGLGKANYSGVDVNHDTALSSTAMLSGVRFIAENIASVPLPIYEKQGRGKKELRDDPRWLLLNRSANPEQTAMEMREMVAGFQVLTGNGYAEIAEGSDGIAGSLWPIPSWRVRPARTPRGALVYLVRRPADNIEVPIPPERMLHFKGFSRNGILGDDLVELVANAIGITLAADQSAGSFFANGSQPGGVLTSEKPLSEKAWDRLSKQRDKMSSMDNRHRLALLEEGVKWQQITSDPQASQLLETRKFQIAEVARILNLPVHILKELDRSTNNNIEHQGIELVTYTFRTLAVRYEQVYTKRLLLPSEQSTHSIKHNLDAFLRGDMKSRYEAHAIGRQWGWRSANDVLEIEDENGIGDQGDTYMVPVNMLDAEQFRSLGLKLVSNNPEPAAEPASTDEDAPDPRADRLAMLEQRRGMRWAPLFTQRLGELVRRESNAIRRALKKAEKDGLQDFRAWLDTFMQENARTLADSMRATFQAYAETVSTDAATFGYRELDSVQTWAAAYAGAFGVRVATESKQLVLDRMRGAAIDEVVAAVTQLVDGWDTTRADEIAAKEIERLNHEAKGDAKRAA